MTQAASQPPGPLWTQVSGVHTAFDHTGVSWPIKPSCDPNAQGRWGVTEHGLAVAVDKAGNVFVTMPCESATSEARRRGFRSGLPHGALYAVGEVLSPELELALENARLRASKSFARGKPAGIWEQLQYPPDMSHKGHYGLEPRCDLLVAVDFDGIAYAAKPTPFHGSAAAIAGYQPSADTIHLPRFEATGPLAQRLNRTRREDVKDGEYLEREKVFRQRTNHDDELLGANWICVDGLRYRNTVDGATFSYPLPSDPSRVNALLEVTGTYAYSNNVLALVNSHGRMYITHACDDAMQDLVDRGYTHRRHFDVPFARSQIAADVEVRELIAEVLGQAVPSFEEIDGISHL